MEQNKKMENANSPEFLKNGWSDGGRRRTGDQRYGSDALERGSGRAAQKWDETYDVVVIGSGLPDWRRPMKPKRPARPSLF